MSTVLSLLGVAAFIVCTISFAAAVTWTVVRISPTSSREKTSESA